LAEQLNMLQRHYVSRVVRAATRQPAVSGALVEAMTLSQPFTVPAKRSVALRMLRIRNGREAPELANLPLLTAIVTMLLCSALYGSWPA
jgi:hypothetical protein